MPYLLKGEPWDEALGSTRTLYASDIGFTSEPWDTPANIHWVRRIDGPMVVERSLWSGDAIGGYSATDPGSAVLANPDGALDHWADYEWDGRVVQIWHTDKEKPVLSDFQLVYNGVADQVVPGDDFEIVLAGLDALLEKPFSRGEFAGSGGIEGSEDMKGRGRPALLGRRRRFTPVLLDSAAQIYMIDPQGYHAILSADDAGDPFEVVGPDLASFDALKALDAGSWDYATSRATGLFRLATKPHGTITVAAEGVAPGGTWISCYADLVRHVITASVPAGSIEFDDASFAAMAVLCPQVLGYWHDGSGSLTVRDLVDELSASVGAHWGGNEARRLEIGRYDGPAAEPDFVIPERHVISITPREIERRMKSLRLSYRPFDTTIDQKDLVNWEAIPPEVRESLGEPVRWTARATHAGAAAASILAREDEDATLFDAGSDAVEERNRRLALFGPAARLFDVEVPLIAGLTAGKTVRLYHHRHGLAEGWNAVVLSAKRERESVHQLTLMGFRNG